jgi:hypothetical protein
MAPIPAEPEEFEYIVIGGGSGGSGTVSLFLFSQPLWECSPLEIRVSADRGGVGKKSSWLVWEEDVVD